MSTCPEDLHAHKYNEFKPLRYLRDNAEIGCRVCAFVLGGLESFLRGEDVDADLLDQTTFMRIRGIYQTLWFLLKRNRADGLHDSVRVEFVCDDGWPADRLGVEHFEILLGMVVPPSACENIDMMKEWINDCVESHANCRLEPGFTLPSRVLDIGVADDAVIQLIETQAFIAPYIALSHRWGTQNLLTTTRATLEARKSRINSDDLSRTFQHAVILTRQLGVRYLWIDSLCIIQDDADDWHAEASRMADIYEAAYTVIAANTSDGALLDEIAGRKAMVRSIASNEPGAMEASVHVRVPLDHAIYSTSSLEGVMEGFEVANGYPLMQRAWCFQERLLATRILHFTDCEVVFECKTGCRCECGDITHSKITMPLKPMYANLIRQPFVASVNVDTPWDGWMRVASPYILKGLTKVEDVLPAVAGIASRVQCSELGMYVAGLWEKYLLQGLFWYAWITSLRDSAVHTGPTFSWVSLAGTSIVQELLWPYLRDESNFQKEIEVVDVDCVVAVSNPYGQLSKASVTIRAAVLPVTIEAAANRPYNAIIRSKTFEERVAVFMDRLMIQQCVPPQAFLCLLGTKFVTSEGNPPNRRLVPRVCALLIRQTSDGRYERHGCLPYLTNEVDWYQDAEEKVVVLI